MKIFIKILFLICLLSFAVSAPFILNGKLLVTEKPKTGTEVLELWHVDSFEGGTGSRKDFLLKSAAAFEKKNEGVLITVINHTPNSVEDNFSKGIFPDLISFGIGVNGVLEYAIPLKTRVDNVFFNSASIGGAVYFYPYAYGRYVLFNNGGNGDTVLSEGKNNLPKFAAMLAGQEYGEDFDTLEAYSLFAAGKYSRLIGTQRDIYRLCVRGKEFECEPLGNFTDMVQYIAVTSKDGGKAKSAEKFAEYLISDEVQLRLGEIGLFSPTGAAVEYGNEYMQKLSSAPDKVFSALLDGQKYSEIKRNDGNKDFFEKFKNYIGQ